MVETAFLAVVSKVKSVIADKFGDKIVLRWTRFRAERFFDSFVEALAEERRGDSESQLANDLMDQLLDDEVKSEILFDAYRRVCFTKSKELGPRIIAILTAELISSGQMASDDEERIFDAAETLSDGEFTEFLKKYHVYREKAKGISSLEAEFCMLGESVIVRWYQEPMRNFGEVELGPFPWVEALGNWAQKLNRCGLLLDRTRQKADILAGDHGMLFQTHITFEPGCADLQRLILRSLRSEKADIE